LWALSKDTKDARYAAFADREYRATTDYLFDKGEHLYFRDSRFFDQRGAHGEKLFWSRGNGWVFSGLARMIPEIPASDPRRPY
ncbi:glycoside hydrolase family 88 protein, partial [Enterobacter cloacae]